MEYVERDKEREDRNFREMSENITVPSSFGIQLYRSVV